MSKTVSPNRFSGDMDHFFDPNFTADISQRMRVPKRIKVDGGGDDEPSNMGNNWSSTLANEKFEMYVPDRILVAGQEQHIGTKAHPRELVLENSVMPPDTGVIRVQTPPRVLTLDNHFFPSADDYVPTSRPEPQEDRMMVPRPRNRISIDQRLANRSGRESTPPLGGGEGLTPSEEVVHLRRQMAKLNRRVMAIELDNLQRQQREKILYVVGLAYFLVKTLFWLNRST